MFDGQSHCLSIPDLLGANKCDECADFTECLSIVEHASDFTELSRDRSQTCKAGTEPVRNRNGTTSAESAGSSRPEPLSRPCTTMHFMVFLLTRGQYGGKSAHFWLSYARTPPSQQTEQLQVWPDATLPCTNKYTAMLTWHI